MNLHHFPFRYRIVLWIFILHGLCLASPGWGQAGGYELETEYTLLIYDSIDSLALFYDAVNYGPGKWNQSAALLSEKKLLKNTASKIDAVFERAQEILDMKKRIPKVRVRLHQDKKALRQAYSKISSGNLRLRAWYLFKNNTVYLNVKDLHEGMLAHELSHGIIDHFLTIKPPPKTAEILARYVDSHLK